MKPTAGTSIATVPIGTWGTTVTSETVSLFALMARIDPNSLDPATVEKGFVCAVAVWFWDRGADAVFHIVVSELLELGACPPAFKRIYREISDECRPRPARRIAKLKGEHVHVLDSIINLMACRAACESTLRQRALPHLRRMTIGRDSDPQAALRRSQRFEKQYRAMQAERAGIDMQTLARAERRFRDLLAEMAKK